MSEEKTAPKLEATKQIAPAGHLSNDEFLELEPGSILLEKYKVVGLLGRGGMGSVYCVEHLQLQKKFALKFLHKHQDDDAAWIRFETEARAANKLDHPNLVKVVDSGLLEEGLPYFIMDLVVGESLSDLLKTAGRLPLEKALKIFIQVGFALSYAHSNGVVHRDIKPSNIMICSTDTEDAQGVLVKVVDFGIAKLTGHDEFNQQTLTKTGEIFGSPLYMSPEQCLGSTVDRRCDLYSLGCVMYEALTGAPPLVGENALATMMKHQTEIPVSLKEASMGVEFPEKMEQIVAQLLEKQPENRYQSAQHLTADLVGLDSGQLSLFEPVRVSPVVARKRQTWGMLAFYGICCLFAGTVAGWVCHLIPQNKEPTLGLSTDRGGPLADVWQQTPERERSEEEKKQAESNIARLEKTPGFFSQDGEQPGERIFNFPDYAIGELVYSKRNRPPAQGKMTFRNFSGLFFAPSEEFQRHAKLFQKFRPDDISKLDLQSQAHVLNVNDRDTRAANSALFGISHLKSIGCIDLGDTVLTTEALLQLDKLPKLQTLLLTRINLSGPEIAKLKRLDMLTTLKLVGIKDIKPLLAKIRNSRSINTLVLSGCSIDSEDLRSLGGIKNLAILEIANNEKINDEALAYLPIGIQDLDIRKCPITSKCIKNLIRLKKLRHLRLDGYGWTDKEMLEIKKNIPDTIFFERDLRR